MTQVKSSKPSPDWKAFGGTDPGKKRQNNEDRILCETERGIFVVADGMGGEAAGEVAAQRAVDVIKTRLHQETGTVARRIREAIAAANNDIFHLAERNPPWRGMACVLTAAVLEDGILHIGHVGDSRLYKILDGQIRKVTSDHSPVGQREDAGELSELEAQSHPRRNEVFRDVGSRLHKPEDDDFIEYTQITFERDTAIVLCSDGLSDMVASDEIFRAVTGNAGRPEGSVRQLIRQANAAGGKDNISVIVVEGKNFAAVCPGYPGDTEASRESPVKQKRVSNDIWASFLQGRWAFLILGLLAGLVLAAALHRNRAPAADEPGPVPAVQAPRILRVESASPEFPTIARALEAARSGDRIEVGDGTYEELIHLKDGVDIAARSPGKAVLRLVKALPDMDAAIVADGIGRASVSGLIIKAEAGSALPYGIRISSSRVDLSNMEISGAVRAGILIDGSSAGTVAASYVHSNSGPGIMIGDTASPFLIGNVLHANGTARGRKGPGLYLTGKSNPEVKRNVFSGNGAEAIRLQRPELKEKMSDNLFVGPGRNARAVVVENVRQ